MRKRSCKKENAHEAVIIWGVITGVSLLLRMWLLFFIGLSVFIVLYIKNKNNNIQEGTEEVVNNIKVIESRNDEEDSYIVIIKKVTELVHLDYPQAKWIWKNPNAKKSIQLGEDVFIILNQAAGYKQAKVVIENNQVCGLDFTIQQNCNTDSDNNVISEDAEPNTGVVAENYELLAYEWVQDNIMLLNERLNESVGQGKTELFLASEELPIKESWQNIVVELEKEGIKDVECIPEGIKIKLLKD